MLTTDLCVQAGHISALPELSPSQLLQKKIRLVNPCCLENTPSVLTHPRLKEFYPELLFVLYSTICASVPMMRAGAKVARERSASDPVCAALAPYLENHAEEELHHDEWMLEDMEVLGLKRSEILKRIPPPAVAALVGAQYYWIYHYHPIALLGYCAALETDPLPAATVEKAMRESGIPPAAFRTLLLHSEHDVNHRDELNRLIDGLPLAPHHVTVMSVSAMQVAAGYEEAFTAVLPSQNE